MYRNALLESVQGHVPTGRKPTSTSARKTIRTYAVAHSFSAGVGSRCLRIAVLNCVSPNNVEGS